MFRKLMFVLILAAAAPASAQVDARMFRQREQEVLAPVPLGIETAPEFVLFAEDHVCTLEAFVLEVNCSARMGAPGALLAVSRSA